VCNLYKLAPSAAEIAAFFGVTLPVPATNAGQEVYPGATGLVIHGAEGGLQLSAMKWGFPLRLSTMKPGSQPKPVNNIADLAKPFWRRYVTGRREDENLVQRQEPGAFRMGSPVAKQLRMGSGLFRRHDRLQ
jgi:putative SOS response-associated peptidase YedK